MVVVPEDDVAEAMVLLMEKAKLVVEGARRRRRGGAARRPDRRRARAARRCVVLSGGNVDAGLLAAVARRHETRGRPAPASSSRACPTARARSARLLALVGEAGANLVDVEHVREGLDLHVRETGVQLVLETRGREHADDVLARRARRGLRGPGGALSGRRAAAVGAIVAVVAGVVAGVLLLTGGGDDDPVPRAPAPAPPARVPAPEPERAPPQPEAPAIGVSVNWLFNGDTYTPAQVEAQLDAMQADGVKLARTDAFWSVAEPEPPAGGVHRYDWGYADRVAGSLARHGVRWLPIISYSALWAASLPDNDKAPPFTPDDYAAYAGAFAERYGRDGRFWAEHPELPATPATAIEIWNEPDNSDFWAPAPNPAGYIDLYLRARTAIRAADPRARVLIGGLTGAPTFLPQLLAARPDARGQIDGVAVHTYSPEPLGALAETRDARRTLVTLGMADVPLWVTEFGWVSRPRNSDKYAAPAKRAAAHRRDDVGAGALGLRRRGRGALRLDHPAAQPARRGRLVRPARPRRRSHGEQPRVRRGHRARSAARPRSRR